LKDKLEMFQMKEIEIPEMEIGDTKSRL
jgi:hypothetical protein